MKIVELWTVGPKDSDSFVLLDSEFDNEYFVINGGYVVIPNKEKSEVVVVGSPFDDNIHESHYLGDVELIDGDYNQTIETYRETKSIVGLNIVKKEIKKQRPKTLDDEIPF